MSRSGDGGSGMIGRVPDRTAAMRYHRMHARARAGRVVRQRRRAYDRFRPSYPAALIDDLSRWAARGARRRLRHRQGRSAARRRAGCRCSVSRSIRRWPRWRAGTAWTVEVTSFEEWDAGGRRFDLVVCRPGVALGRPGAWRCRRPRRCCGPAATIAVFWNIGSIEEPLRPSWTGCTGIRAPAVVARQRRAPGHRAAVRARPRTRAGCSTPAFVRDYEWEQTYSDRALGADGADPQRPRHPRRQGACRGGRRRRRRDRCQRRTDAARRYAPTPSSPMYRARDRPWQARPYGADDPARRRRGARRIPVTRVHQYLARRPPGVHPRRRGVRRCPPCSCRTGRSSSTCRR